MDEQWGSKLSTWIAVSIYGSCCSSFVLLLHTNWKGTIFEHQMRQKAWMEQWLIWATCEGTSGTSRSNRWTRTQRRNYQWAIGKLCGWQNSTRHWTLLAQKHLYLSVPCQRIVALQEAEKCRVWRNVLGRVCLWKGSTVLCDLEFPLSLFEIGHLYTSQVSLVLTMEPRISLSSQKSYCPTLSFAYTPGLEGFLAQNGKGRGIIWIPWGMHTLQV